MGRSRFGGAPCPIARTTDLMGDPWTPVLMREAFRGVRRFDDFQRSLSLSRGVLAQRLVRLVEAGLLERSLYEKHPQRHEYVLTDKGRDFYSVLAAMWRFGADWLWPEGEAPPVAIVDEKSGKTVRPRVVDERTGRPIDVSRVRVAERS